MFREFGLTFRQRQSLRCLPSTRTRERSLGFTRVGYPAPPVLPAALQAKLDSVITLCDQVVAAKAAAEQVTQTKDAGLEKLVEKMKSDLRYAETTVDFDDAKLTLLGWGGKATGVALQAPGQARTLEAPRQGEGSVFLGRKRGLYQGSESPSETGLSPFSADGGAVASYKIERRDRPAGPWEVIGVAIETEATMNNQTRAKDWQYRVIAVNNAGEGVPSNTVAAVV